MNKSGPPHSPKITLSTGNPEYVIEGGEGMQAKRISATSVQTHIFKYMHGRLNYKLRKTKLGFRRNPIYFN